jgi:hypothetical protein
MTGFFLRPAMPDYFAAGSDAALAAAEAEAAALAEAAGAAGAGTSGSLNLPPDWLAM